MYDVTYISGRFSSSGFPGVPGFGFEGKRHSAEQDTRMALRWRLMAIRPLAIILSEGSASFGCFSLLLRLRGDSFAQEANLVHLAGTKAKACQRYNSTA